MSVPRPQDTGCTRIAIETGDETLDEGVTNGILSFISGARWVEYDEERDVYIVAEATR